MQERESGGTFSFRRKLKMDNIATANSLKEQGNAQYKQRNFPAAIALYEQAWATNQDITFLNNLSGPFQHSSLAHGTTADPRGG